MCKSQLNSVIPACRRLIHLEICTQRIGRFMKYKILLRHTVLFIAVCGTSACSSLGVEPWQRGTLAKSEMSLSGESVDMSLDDHIYFSKEGTSGGRGFAGGGCGCN